MDAATPPGSQALPPLRCVLHVAPMCWRAVSGLSCAVQGLLRAQARRADLRVALLTSWARPEPVPAGLPYPVYAARPARAGRLVAGLPAPFDRPDLVVLHSTYVPLQVAVALEAVVRGVPYVVVPHGGLTRGVQAHRHLKKALVNGAFFRALVRRAAAVQFLSEQEARDSAGWGRRHVVAGNGTELPAEDACAHPGAAAAPRLLFLGRLDPVQKGLDLLLEACASRRALLAARGVQVELWGPDHQGSEAALRARIDALGLAGHVRLCGVVRGARKDAVLRAGDLFLHPSRFEGHPMAVLEALAHGLPCLVTPGTGMDAEVARAGAGWAVAGEAQALARALDEALGPGGAQALRERGARARRLAVERFSWDAMAGAAVQHYRPLVRRPPPRAAAAPEPARRTPAEAAP